MKKAKLVKRTFWIREDQDEALKEISQREERTKRYVVYRLGGGIIRAESYDLDEAKQKAHDWKRFTDKQYEVTLLQKGRGPIAIYNTKEGDKHPQGV
jgi:hypothetical protein